MTGASFKAVFLVVLLAFAVCQHDSVASEAAHAHLEWENEVTGSNIQLPSDIVVIEVAPSISDNGAVLSLKDGIRKALRLKRSGKSVLVRLAAGLYCEPLSIRSPKSVGMLVIEGPTDGEAIITGSEDWSGADGWQVDPRAPRVLVAEWGKEWGDNLVVHESSREGDSAPWLKAHAADDATIVLEWKPADSSGTGRFRVYRRESLKDQTNRIQGKTVQKSGEFQLAHEGQGRSFVDRDVVASKPWKAHSYSYRVVEVQSDGSESPGLNVVAVTPGDSSDISRPDALGRRREMVFVDGQRLTQILPSDRLSPGSYRVEDGYPGDPTDNRIEVMLPAGAQLGQARIEVGVIEAQTEEAGFWDISATENILLRNLTFQHAPTAKAGGGALRILGSKNILIENCLFQWNNGTGLQVRYSESVTLAQIRASDNGGTGILSVGVNNLLATDIKTNRNNWRGQWGNIDRWDFAGFKLGFGARGVVVRRHIAHDNFGHGLWIDHNVKRIVVDELDSRRNSRFGLFVEAIHGPVVIRSSRLIHNLQGIHLANSSNGVLHDTLCLGNREAQLFTLRRLNRPVIDPDLQQGRAAGGKPVPSVERNVDHWTWTSNIFVAEDSGQRVIDVLPLPQFFETFQASGNLYWSRNPRNAFQVGERSFDFADWQKFTGQDLDSVFADPRFTAMSQGDFTPLPTSPLMRRNTWQEKTVGTPGYQKLPSASDAPPRDGVWEE